MAVLPPPDVAVVGPNGIVNKDWYDWFRSLADAIAAAASGDGGSGSAKFWVKFRGSDAAILASFNVASVSKIGVGEWTVNIDTDFAGHWVLGACGGLNISIGVNSLIYNTQQVLPGSVQIRATDGAGSGFDPTTPDAVFVVGFGDQ